MVALCGCLAANRSLRLVDLSLNRVTGPRVAGPLARALAANGSLRELRLEVWHDTFDDPQVGTCRTWELCYGWGQESERLAGAGSSKRET